MTCFVCRKPVTAHVIRALKNLDGAVGWGRVCLPCALKHNLGGVLYLPSNIADEWFTPQRPESDEPSR